MTFPFHLRVKNTPLYYVSSAELHWDTINAICKLNSITILNNCTVVQTYIKFVVEIK